MRADHVRKDRVVNADGVIAAAVEAVGAVDAKVLYKTGNRFPAAGHYVIRLEQAMRTERLEGVMDVGVSLERMP